MKIVKNAGSFEILPSDPHLSVQEDLQGQLLRIERAGRTCYQSERCPITLETATRFVRMLVTRGHESVIEHGFMTVRFANVSRGFTHELVRHRLASFSQESTRYVDYSKKGEGPDITGFQLYCVVPPHRDENALIDLGEGRMLSAAQMLEETERFYRALRRAGWSPEDARQILPTAVRAEIVASANFREWRHIFRMRTQRAAHWEIRSVMCSLLGTVQKLVPAVFEDFVPAGEDNYGLRYYEQRASK